MVNARKVETNRAGDQAVTRDTRSGPHVTQPSEASVATKHTSKRALVTFVARPSAPESRGGGILSGPRVRPASVPRATLFESIAAPSQQPAVPTSRDYPGVSSAHPKLPEMVKRAGPNKPMTPSVCWYGSSPPDRSPCPSIRSSEGRLAGVWVIRHGRPNRPAGSASPEAPSDSPIESKFSPDAQATATGLIYHASHAKGADSRYPAGDFERRPS